MTERILVIAPHRDDEAIGCGGVLALHAAKGDETYVVHLCGVGAPRDEVESAAQILGVSELRFCDGPAVRIAADDRLLIELVTTIRELEPSIVYSPHESDDDPTHRVVGQTTAEALWISCFPVYAEAGPILKQRVAWHLQYEVWSPISRPTVIVDISSVIDVKIRAIEAYRSQLQYQDYDHGTMGLNRYRGTATGCTYAEAFDIVKAPNRLIGDHWTAEKDLLL